MRIAYFDLETSDLKGDVGRILCGSILVDGKMKTFSNASKSKADDRRVAVQIRDELEKAHLLVSWFGKGFDVAFLRTRLVAAGERPLRPILHLDPNWYMRGWRGLSPRNSKLAVAAEFFNLKGRKMEVDVSVWIDAALGGDSKAMKILMQRCESDVEILKAVTDKILDTGLVKNISVY